MQVSVVYINEQRQLWQEFEITEHATVQDAIERSGVMKRFPELDTEQLRVGIFGKLTKLDAPLSEGDRVEIYRPIIADPMTVHRRDRPPVSSDE